MFSKVLDLNKPFFEETLRMLIETQFDFVAQNPQLPMFVFREILANPENRKWALSTFAPKLIPFFIALDKSLNEEIAKGTVRQMSVIHLLMNVLSMNISTFIAMPVLQEAFQLDKGEKMEKFLAERRESNVQFILNALRP
ncbi:MAG: hypothetical protein LBS52_00875, partial [Dysgonamonadaceae bacterium]|jgi:hypothetical protein|nr:hypothetical protein [Dysgonamonadaceae bacterium]